MRTFFFREFITPALYQRAGPGGSPGPREASSERSRRRIRRAGRSVLHLVGALRIRGVLRALVDVRAGGLVGSHGPGRLLLVAGHRLAGAAHGLAAPRFLVGALEVLGELLGLLVDLVELEPVLVRD